MSLLDVAGLSVHFGGIRALDDMSLTVDEGQICGLIGPNGAGKTTLFNCVTRLYVPSSGSITFAGRDLLTVPTHGVAGLGIARTFQNLGLFQTMTVLDNVMLGAAVRARIGFFRGAFRPPGVRRAERATEEFAREILALLDLDAVADHLADGLPFGTMKRLELARAVVARPRLLLLDEPACGLTQGEVKELGELIVRLRRQLDLSILLVEHHMALVMGISDKVVALDFGKKIADGRPSEVRENPAVIRAYLGATA